jgi:CDP-diacylglycerol--serine O-phosphatidyltransferase
MGEHGAPKKPSKYILGLPIPGAAGIFVSLVVASDSVSGHLEKEPLIVLAVILALSFFMVSTIKFRSFKDVRLSWRSMLLVVVAVGSSAAVAVRFHISFALVWLLSSYITIGIVEAIFALSRRRLKKPGIGSNSVAEVRPHGQARSTDPEADGRPESKDGISSP